MTAQSVIQTHFMNFVGLAHDNRLDMWLVLCAHPAVWPARCCSTSCRAPSTLDLHTREMHTDSLDTEGLLLIWTVSLT